MRQNIHSWLFVIGFLSLTLGAPVKAAPFPFSMVSFNTWGVPFAVKDTFRYAAAMREIEKLAPDFVFLEEVFSHKGRRGFHSELFPYEVNGPRALPKLVSSGLRLLSKYPVVRSAKMAFADCVKDDCLSKKGALLALVELPDGKKVNLVGTHLNARGDETIRVAQINQLKSFIDEFAEPGYPTLISGDFNYSPLSPEYTYGLKTFDVKDAWTEVHGDQDLGLTYDSDLNEYAHDYCLQHNFPLVKERIDLLLIQSAEQLKLQPVNSRLIFNEKPYYSDHFGLFATFTLTE